MKNKTNYFRTPKDIEHPYNMYDAKLWNLPNDELLIMLCIFSNKTEIIYEDDVIWILNRIEIQKRLQQGGMGERTFRKVWMALENKHYIVKKRFKGGVEWTVYEDPELYLKTPNTNTKTLKRYKPVKPLKDAKEKEIIHIKTIEELTIEKENAYEEVMKKYFKTE